ncbi:transcription antitermination factor NusB [Luteimicrobium xylanilyticum]|uniref:16S rRNA (Cytosine(967)-C(5))-methyltransferase n=1 Tax=Luteimicrobium xylanilyticum TaxID=1133546 RepID=A0A5P9QA74_9MICO|nr:transcription antitermination factor NusB [Luteimicrobium xylanilyticum]QFU98327.1 16S rRNA (cytosine(967)-C(5))-methyltransferase [Luteimicrobium xylanilyticum]
MSGQGQGRDGRRGSGGRGRGNDHGRDARGRERGEARLRGDRNRSSQVPSQRRRAADPARTAAFDVLRDVAASDAYANLVLPPLLRERRIEGRDAAFATELAYGTLRLRGRYDAILSVCSSRPLTETDPPVLDALRLGAHQLLGMRVPPHAAVSETVGLVRDRIGSGAAQFVNAVLRRVGERDLDAWLEDLRVEAPDETAALAATQSHPAWIVRALRESLVGNGLTADDLPALLEADNTAPRVTLVARPGLADPDEVVTDTHGTPGRWAPTAVVLPGSDPAAVPGVAEGRVGVQDEGSQLVTLALAAADLGSPATGTVERWLDLCAGPGGKAALLGALALERGATVVANELAPHRAKLVERSVRAVRGAVTEVRTADGRDVGADEPAAYDRVLLDAPCTGLGALRRRPESRWRRTPSDLQDLTALQRELLASALDAVRPGGLVAYVTCSPHLAETRVVVDDVLRRRDDVERVDAAEAVRRVAGDSIPLADRLDVQLWPHVHGTDAMHLTLLRRRAGE